MNLSCVRHFVYVGHQYVIKCPVCTVEKGVLVDLISFIHSFSILSDDRSKASSKTMPPHTAIQSLLLQVRISSPVLKVIQ